jgi:hypothetical protein
MQTSKSQFVLYEAKSNTPNPSELGLQLDLLMGITMVITPILSLWSYIHLWLELRPQVLRVAATAGKQTAKSI